MSNFYKDHREKILPYVTKFQYNKSNINRILNDAPLMPNITNSPQDKIILDEFCDITDNIIKQIKMDYSDNKLIQGPDHPKAIHCFLKFSKINDKTTYSGNIKVFNYEGNGMKSLPIELIISNNGFIIQSSQEWQPTSYSVVYDIDRNIGLKNTMIEAILEHSEVIKTINYKRGI